MSTESPTTVPADGRHTPARMRRSVVLPAPFAPTSATVSPGATVKEMSSSSGLRPQEKDMCLTSSIKGHYFTKI